MDFAYFRERVCVCLGTYARRAFPGSDDSFIDALLYGSPSDDPIIHDVRSMVDTALRRVLLALVILCKLHPRMEPRRERVLDVTGIRMSHGYCSDVYESCGGV